MNPGKKRRLERILKQDNRTVIVPMDHGVSSGPLKGIENIQETINRLMAGGAEAAAQYACPKARSIVGKGSSAAEGRSKGDQAGLNIVDVVARGEIGK